MATSSSSCGDSDRYITLNSRVGQYVAGQTQGFELRLEVTEACNVDQDIFVFHRRANSVAGGDPIDEFSNVATPFDLDAYAADAPAAGQEYYRLSEVNLVFRNRDSLSQSLIDIETDTQELIRNLSQLSGLTNDNDVLDLTESTHIEA